jgi:hypothetical protein
MTSLRQLLLRWLPVLVTMLCGITTGFSFSSQIQNRCDEAIYLVPTTTPIQEFFSGDDFHAARATDNLATTPLMRNITGVADDALVHFGPEGYSVIKPGAGGQVFSFQYGDIKHLTPRQIESVIGDLSISGQRGGSRVMHILDANPGGATRTPGAVVSEIPEFIFEQPVPVSGGFIVQ